VDESTVDERVSWVGRPGRVSACAVGGTLVAKLKATGSRSVLIASIALFSAEFLFLACWSIHEFGSIRAGIAYLNGDRLLVDPYVLSFGDMQKGESRAIEVELDNRADHRVAVHHVSRSQICSITRQFPIRIDAGERVRIPISVHAGTVGSVEEHILLLTDDRYQPLIGVTIKGRVLETARGSPGE